MNIRKLTSLTALVSFVLMILTSIILYIVPQGRIAYWADWRLWGLTKTQWTDFHLNLGVLFLLAICLHIYYNWNPILAYLKNKARQLKVFTKEFNMALVLALVFLLGTYFEVPPFSTIIEISNSIKTRLQGIMANHPMATPNFHRSKPLRARSNSTWRTA